MVMIFFFFKKNFFFFVGKVVRYNTALARFRDNPVGGQRIDQKRKKGWWRGRRERVEREKRED